MEASDAAKRALDAPPHTRQGESESNLEEQPRYSEDLLDFNLRATCHSLDGVGGKIGVVSSSLWLLGALCFLLSYGSGVENQARMPIFGLPVDRWYAAGLCALGACGLFYRSGLLRLHEMLLFEKLHLLLHYRCGAAVDAWGWNLLHPTLINSAEIAQCVHRSGKLGFEVAGRAFSVAGISLPMMAVLKIVLHSQYSLGSILVAVGCAYLVVMGMLHYRATRKGNWSELLRVEWPESDSRRGEEPADSSQH